jgi:hypothetical protein
MMEAVCTSKTLVYSSETTQRYIPEGSYSRLRVECATVKTTKKMIVVPIVCKILKFVVYWL